MGNAQLSEPERQKRGVSRTLKKILPSGPGVLKLQGRWEWEGRQERV